MIGLLMSVGLAAATATCVVQGGAGRRGGQVVESGAAVESGAQAATEVALVGAGRAHLDPRSILVCGTPVELRAGRTWVVTSGSLELRAGRQRLQIQPRSSVVVQVDGPGRVTVAVARGRVDRAGGASVRAGEVDAGSGPQPGGAGTFDLVRRATSDRRWAAAATRAEILRRLGQPLVHRPRIEALGPGLWGDAEVFGSDGGPAGRLLEAGIRPSPFPPDR